MTTLFIGQLSPDTRTRDVENLFEKYGRIKDCHLHKNCAFVTFEDCRDAADSYKECQGKEICGKRINIEWAKSPSRSESRRRDKYEPKPHSNFGRSIISIAKQLKPEAYLDIDATTYLDYQLNSLVTDILNRALQDGKTNISGDDVKSATSKILGRN